MSYLLLIGCIQAFFLGILILTQNIAHLPNRILMVWMMVLGLNLFGAFLAILGFYENHPQWFGFDSTLVLLHGPFAYLYVAYYINREKAPRKWDVIHFLPYLFFTVYFLCQVKTSADDYASKKELIYNPDPVILTMLISIQVLLIAYSLLIFNKLRRQRSKIEAVYSFVEGIDLQWVKNMMWILIGVVVLTVAGVVLSDLFTFISSEVKTYFLYGCLAIVPFYIVYQAVRYDIFTIGFTQSQPDNSYAGSNLTPAESGLILDRLDRLMRTDKPYLDNYLTIAKLAGMLDTHSKYLSQVINEKKQTSFFNYINQYRVQEVIDKMDHKAYKHFTILGIALDTGFNSKSAFNKAFKKVTGFTPSAYRKTRP